MEKERQEMDSTNKRLEIKLRSFDEDLQAWEKKLCEQRAELKERLEQMEEMETEIEKSTEEI